MSIRYSCLIHLKQKPTNYGNVDVKVTTDGGSTFYHVAKSVQIGQKIL